MHAFMEIAKAAEHEPCGRGPRHRRGAAGHRAGASGGDPGGDLLQQALGTDSDRIVAGYESFADEFATILSRQLDS
jgi:biopolymer transport protein TolQ